MQSLLENDLVCESATGIPEPRNEDWHPCHPLTIVPRQLQATLTLRSVTGTKRELPPHCLAHVKAHHNPTRGWCIEHYPWVMLRGPGLGRRGIWVSRSGWFPPPPSTTHGAALPSRRENACTPNGYLRPASQIDYAASPSSLENSASQKMRLCKCPFARSFSSMTLKWCQRMLTMSICHTTF